MSKQKIGEDAFAYYVSLGPERSYQLVADRYEVHKRSVVKRAGVENWTARLAAIEQDAQERVDKKLAEGIADTRARHLKLVRAMASRAAQAIHEYPLTSGMDGLRAADMVIKLERTLMGEPSERTAVTVEAVTKAEIDKLVARDGENGDGDEADDEDDW